MLPGSDGPVQGEEQAIKIAKELGYPVIIKAVAGGGGRGMRVVRSADELAKSLKTAMREAEAAFGVGDVYLEKYVESPRHIEIQVLGDHHGNVVHLGERECSIQRRHQKLIEEAPSVALTEKQRRRLGATVVDAARAVQYTNAGTFEFLMDPGGHFYFLEANTRLQVEHPVTEFITGIDIVKEQIRIAAGQRLSFKQSDIEFRGHSIECRINAEDPETFAPSPGVIHAFSVPGGPGVRVDTFAHSECTVSPYYDSLIAKIITHGRDRTEAIARMRRTLEMTVVDGIKTSIPLHLKILADPDFVAGRLSTSFMERFMPDARKSSGRQAGRVGLTEARVSVPRFLPRLYAILDVDAVRAPAARARSTLLDAWLGRRRPAGPAARQAPDDAGRSSSWPSRMAAALPRGAARIFIVNDRADVARLARRGRRPRRAGRSVAGRRARVVGAGRRRRPVDAHRRAGRAPALDDAGRLPGDRPGVRDTAARRMPDPVVGLAGVREAAALARTRGRGRSWRSAASRSTERREVIAAGRRLGGGDLGPARRRPADARPRSI